MVRFGLGLELVQGLGLGYVGLVRGKSQGISLGLWLRIGSLCS